MEIETNTSGDKSPDISDAQRLAASSRVSNLAPLHSDVTADEDSPEMTVNQHILEGPLGNSPSETEATVGTGGITMRADVSKPYALIGVAALVAGAVTAMFVIIL